MLKVHELDTLKYESEWISDEEFYVERIVDGVCRAKWKFKNSEKMQWKVTECKHVYVRRGDNRPGVDETRVPADIRMAAAKFLRKQIKILPRKIASPAKIAD